MRHIMAIALLLGSTAFFASSCGSKTPSCEDAVSHFYAQHCTLVDGDGYEIPLSSAIDMCEDSADQSKDCGCYDAHEALRSCFNGIGDEQCYDCQPEWDDLMNCLSSCD